MKKKLRKIFHIIWEIIKVIFGQCNLICAGICAFLGYHGLNYSTRYFYYILAVFFLVANEIKGLAAVIQNRNKSIDNLADLNIEEAKMIRLLTKEMLLEKRVKNGEN